MKNLWNYLQYLAASRVIGLLSLLPRSAFAPIAVFCSHILYLIPQIGGVTRMNLSVVFPEKTSRDRKRIAMGSLRNLILTLMEFFWGRRHLDELMALIDRVPEADATSAAAHAQPAPSIFVTPHLGNWELSGKMLALTFQFPVGIVVRSPRNPYLDRLITAGRQEQGVRLIYSKNAVRTMVRTLKEGDSLGVLIDQNTRVRNGGEFVNFFGLPVPVSMAPAHLARKGNHYVAIGCTVRVDGGRFLTYLKPLSKPSADYASDAELTQELMDLSESFIRAYPDQYLWMYKRFQYIPREADESLRRKYPPYAAVPGEKFYRSSARQVRRETENRME